MISVVIPVFNVAPYLHECLQSMLAQTNTNWEAICVDDGSTDGSGSILEEYAGRDKRFRMVQQENSGVCAARNRGLDAVRGEYFIFVDPDDVLQEDYLEQLLVLVKGRTSCVGVIGMTEFYDDTPSKKNLWSPEFGDGVLNLDAYALRFGIGAMGNKIYPSSVLSGGLRFVDGLKIGEDVLFVVRALSHVSHISVNGSYHGYHYRLRSKSACHGISAYAIAKCYWDDAVALAKSIEGSSDRYLVREWLIRCVVGHMFGEFTCRDLVRLVSAMRNDGIEIWRSIVDLTERAVDVRYENWKHRVARPYAKVILGCNSSASAAILLKLITVYFKLKFKLEGVHR